VKHKDIPSKDRLIFAMDVPTVDQAKELALELDDAVTFYKIGLELMMSGQYFELLDWLLERDKKVFCDLKFFDIPATVGSAVRSLKDRGATFGARLRPDHILGRSDVRSDNPVGIEFGDDIVGDPGNMPVNTQFLRAPRLQPANTQILGRDKTGVVLRPQGRFKLLPQSG